MGNDDIRIDVGFFDSPKTMKLFRLLGNDGVVGLLRLWAWAAKHRPKGLLYGVLNCDIEQVAGWTGDEDEFVLGLVQAGFLDSLQDIDDDYQIHDWKDHQGYVYHSLERSERGRKAAEARWHKKPDAKSCNEHMPDDTSSTCSTMQRQNAPTPSPVPNPVPDPIPDKEVNPVFKKPESKSKDSPSDRFKWYVADHQQDIIDIGKELFLDLPTIVDEIVKMKTWVLANPVKGNKKDWKRFVGGWLARVRDHKNGQPPMSKDQEDKHYESHRRRST